MVSDQYLTSPQRRANTEQTGAENGGVNPYSYANSKEVSKSDHGYLSMKGVMKDGRDGYLTMKGIAKDGHDGSLPYAGATEADHGTTKSDTEYYPVSRNNSEE